MWSLNVPVLTYFKSQKKVVGPITRASCAVGRLPTLGEQVLPVLTEAIGLVIDKFSSIALRIS